MTITVLPAAARPAMPWKNGGGVTREVAVRPGSHGAPADFDWRASLADVARDGPFSPFDGYDRVITLVGGSGMVLTIDDVVHRVDAPYRPLPFPGDSATGCELIDGPIVDFNVMTRRGAFVSTVEFVGLTTARKTFAVPRCDAPEIALVVVFEGPATLVGEPATELGVLDAVLIQGEPPTFITADAATLAFVRITEL